MTDREQDAAEGVSCGCALGKRPWEVRVLRPEAWESNHGYFTYPAQRASWRTDTELKAPLSPFLCPPTSILLVSTSFQSDKESREAHTPSQAMRDKASLAGLAHSEPVRVHG